MFNFSKRKKKKTPREQIIEDIRKAVLEFKEELIKYNEYVEKRVQEI